MKNLYKFSFIAILLLFAFTQNACNNNRGRGNNMDPNVAGVPTSICLLSPNNYQGQCNYNYASYYGFFAYDYNLYVNGLTNNYSNGFCGCGQSGYPVYNSNWGLGCINNANIPQTYNYTNPTRFLMYTWNSTTLQWNKYQSSANSYYPGYNSYNGGYNNYGYGSYGYGAGNSCPYSAILSCDIGSQNSCGPGAVCRSLSNSGGGGSYSQSGPGVCVLNYQGYNYY